ncbi:AAA family ATPase [Dietzia psychralcaliphila]|uniref:AAA family ATPase n=1 Tax=Dietzia psychralcaliphila TaxID=139021 RepID=UPI000D3FDB12|nr:AAA family ATPase [Dietzia psychralcaliphila]PTM87368.1 PIF1-like helicase [Dietzia psychralcaliphila]
MIDSARVPHSDSDIVLTDEFELALAHLHSGENLFLTGKAGTGKSTLIRHFLAETELPTLVVAPTGIAALNIGGYTIHRVFGFHPSHTIEHVQSAAYRPGRFADALAAVRTLVLDEASMLRADVFDMIAIALGRFGPDPSMPFGGVQIVLVGDLFQLPPVVTASEKSGFESTYATPYFFSAQRYRGEDFHTVDLTHVFRQSGDPRLTAILNAIREGALVGHARDEINARTDPHFEPPDDEFWLTLTTTNRIATNRNRRRLERLPGSELAMTATTTGDIAGFDLPTDETLRFKVGAQIMMVTNDPSDRWVNGSIGRVLDVTLGGRVDRGARSPVVIVAFTGGEVAEVPLYTWDVTRPVAAGAGMRHEIVGTFSQFPFTLAWAITIHKSQGQTLDRLVVDLSGGTFATGQLYVALSRCRSLAGLVLTRPVVPKDLKTDRRIIRFLRAPELDGPGRRFCSIATLTVGDENPRSRSRPVELAVAFSDGTAISTLVNPQRDLAEARTDYRVTVSDVLLAPTLLEAWSMIAPLLDGHTPVGIDVDSTLGHIDSELKRLGSAIAMPPGVDIPSQHLTPKERTRTRSGSALDRARVALEVRAHLAADDAAAGVFDADLVEETAISYLLSRDIDANPPTSDVLPQLSAMLEVSGRVGSALLGLRHPQAGPDADDGPDGADGTAGPDGRDDDELLFAGDRDLEAGARALVADQIRAAAERVTLDAETMTRLRRAGDLLGVDLAAGLEAAGSAIAGEVLVPGTRVCFTGSALDPSGNLLSRGEMESLAAARGLIAVGNVTRTRCDALVVAEVGSQSSKARNARKWDKPVISVADFLCWADDRPITG